MAKNNENMVDADDIIPELDGFRVLEQKLNADQLLIMKIAGQTTVESIESIKPESWGEAKAEWLLSECKNDIHKAMSYLCEIYTRKTGRVVSSRVFEIAADTGEIMEEAA